MPIRMGRDILGVRTSNPYPQTDQKIRDLHWRYTEAHPCEKTAVIMLSPGPDYRTERFLSGVWSKFYAISSQNSGLTPGDLLREYRNSVSQRP